MQIELVHPNGINTRKCNPKQAERLRKAGWRDADGGQPLAEVLKFQAMPKEVAEVINSGCTCNGACESKKEPEVVNFNEPAEEVKEFKPRGRKKSDL